MSENMALLVWNLTEERIVRLPCGFRIAVALFSFEDPRGRHVFVILGSSLLRILSTVVVWEPFMNCSAFSVSCGILSELEPLSPPSETHLPHGPLPTPTAKCHQEFVLPGGVDFTPAGSCQAGRSHFLDKIEVLGG